MAVVAESRRDRRPAIALACARDDARSDPIVPRGPGPVPRSGLGSSVEAWLRGEIDSPSAPKDLPMLVIVVRRSAVMMAGRPGRIPTLQRRGILCSGAAELLTGGSSWYASCRWRLGKLGTSYGRMKRVVLR